MAILDAATWATKNGHTAQSLKPRATKCWAKSWFGRMMPSKRIRSIICNPILQIIPAIYVYTRVLYIYIHSICIRVYGGFLEMCHPQNHWFQQTTSEILWTLCWYDGMSIKKVAWAIPSLSVIFYPSDIWLRFSKNSSKNIRSYHILSSYSKKNTKWQNRYFEFSNVCRPKTFRKSRFGAKVFPQNWHQRCDQTGPIYSSF